MYHYCKSVYHNCLCITVLCTPEVSTIVVPVPLSRTPLLSVYHHVIIYAKFFVYHCFVGTTVSMYHCALCTSLLSVYHCISCVPHCIPLLSMQDCFARKRRLRTAGFSIPLSCAPHVCCTILVTCHFYISVAKNEGHAENHALERSH